MKKKWKRKIDLADGIDKLFSKAFKWLLTKGITRLILDLIILKGSTDMYLFATTTTYTSNQTMQNNQYGLNVVCKYLGYEEK